MKHYVVGLAFNQAADLVVLIEKRRPQWQAGKLNGVGGQVEFGETALIAMRREFKEETGIEVIDWTHIASLEDAKAIVDIFSCFNDAVLQSAQTTDEPIRILSPQDALITSHGIADLSTLIVRALNRDEAACLHLGTSRLLNERAPLCR